MNEIKALEDEISLLTEKLFKLRRTAKPEPVENYRFQTLDGETSLLKMFENKDTLFVIHNMGESCNFCTLWADGLNGFLPHLEDRFAMVLVSKDSPESQRRFALSRQWGFRMASHAGEDYIVEQNLKTDTPNFPGIVCYRKQGSQIFRHNSSVFGPGDLYCAIWPILSLAGISENEWAPKYNYWKAKKQLTDKELVL